MNYALIFAGGVGRRMNTSGVPKQFLKVQGIPIIIHTVKKFEGSKEIDGIVIVCVEEYIELMTELINKYNIHKVLKITKGGETGQGSIFNGLSVLNDLKIDDEDIVLIHDGVRPLIDEKLIESNILSVKKYGNAISASISNETIVTINTNKEVIDITDRLNTYVAKAPQSFYFKDIYSAHLKAIEENKTNFIDSCTMMKYYGATPHIVKCSSKNIKITTPEDYYIFKSFLMLEENLDIIGV